jgi:hypothetical protein
MQAKYRFTFFLVSVFIFSQFFISNAYAYIDPGSVSVAFALVIGVLVGAGMTIKLYWIKLKNKLSRKTD